MRSASVRAVTRIAWRGIGRSRGRSALIVMLMLLPAAAMAGAITLLATVSPTTEESATHRMGVADYEVQQSSDITTDSLRAALPPGAMVEPWTYDISRLMLPGRAVGVDLRSMDLDGLASGKLVVTGGRQPHDEHEVAISAAVAELPGVGLHGSIELEGWGTRTVVGLVEDTLDISARLVLLHASVARATGQGENTGASPVWLVSVPEGTDIVFGVDDCEAGCEFIAYSRYQFPASSDDESAGVLVLGGLALVEAILVAAAAFAVGLRRRQRELGLLAAAGAERRHLAGTVLSEGALLGALAAGGGVGLGVLAVVAVSPWLDGLLNRRVGSVEINGPFLFAVGAIALLACLVAAALPARSAARLPVLLALSGRRPPLSPARRLLVLGVVLVALGVFLTTTGAAMRLSDAGGSLSAFWMLGGAIMGVLGFGACSPWLVERLERFVMRLPVSARIALRDTARARSRNAPIVTAVLAAFAATVAISAYFASSDAESAARWEPWLRADQLIIQGDGAERAGADAAADLRALAAAPIPWLGATDGRAVYVEIEDRTSPEDERIVASTPTVGDAQLLTALGAEAAVPVLDGGGVVLFMSEPRDLATATVVVHDEYGAAAELTLPATVVDSGRVLVGSLADAVMAPATAERLGLSATGASTYVIRLPRPVGEADVARAATFAQQQPGTSADAALGPTRPDRTFRLLLVALSLLFALSVTGIAVALGEAESRPDQRTLLAIGADPGIRRRIAAARAGVLALMAGLLAVPAGLLPVWGLLGSRGVPLIVPVPEVVAAVVILPLAGILGALLLSRRIPPWSALREAGS